MKRLLRIFGLAAALALVSLTTVEAFPAWDGCYYTCDGDGSYQTWASYADCCSSNPSVLYCPPGQTPQGTMWGGYDYQLQECMWVQ